MSLLAICILVYIYKCNAECWYEWSDDTDLKFNPYELTPEHDEPGCIAIYIEPTSNVDSRENSVDFEWIKIDCEETLPFICNNCNDYRGEPPDYTVPSNGNYITLNWNEANGYCEEECDSSLASIHIDHQYVSIKNILRDTQEFDTVWIGLHRTCEYISTTNINQDEKRSAEFIGMPIETGISVLVISLTVAACIFCAIGWLCYSNQKKQNNEMQKEMAVIQKKLSALQDEKQQKPHDESPGSVHNNGSGFPITKTSERDEEGNGNIEMQEGVQQEGHTKITKIESAVHLEVLPGDEYNNDDDEEDDEKDNVLLDAMLSDVMKMPSLDPNQISEVNDNEIVQKRNNESESENTDDMYDDEQSDEQVIKVEVNEYEENVMDLETKQTKIDINEDYDEDKDNINGNNEVLVDRNEMEKGIDNNMENEQNKENNENESDDSDNMYEQ